MTGVRAKTLPKNQKLQAITLRCLCFVHFFLFHNIVFSLFLPWPLPPIFLLPQKKENLSFTHSHKSFPIFSSVTVSYLKFSRQIIRLSDISPSESYFTSEAPSKSGSRWSFLVTTLSKWHTGTEEPAKIQHIGTNRNIQISIFCPHNSIEKTDRWSD